MTKSCAYLISKLLIVLTPLVWVAWDLYAYAKFGHEATISHALYEWSLVHWWLPVAIGIAGVILFCHWFITRPDPTVFVDVPRVKPDPTRPASAPPAPSPRPDGDDLS